MEDRLIVTASPHIRDASTTRGLMGNVVIALLPAVLAAGLIFGVQALVLVAVTTLACVAFEYIYEKLLKKSNTVGDLSAVVTGIILALNMPVGMPLWIAVVGAFVAIVITKQLFGGLGYNFANPALVGRIVLFLGFTSRMTAYVYPDMAVDALDHRFDELRRSADARAASVEPGGGLHKVRARFDGNVRRAKSLFQRQRVGFEDDLYRGAVFVANVTNGLNVRADLIPKSTLDPAVVRDDVQLVDVPALAVFLRLHNLGRGGGQPKRKVADDADLRVGAAGELGGDVERRRVDADGCAPKVDAFLNVSPDFVLRELRFEYGLVNVARELANGHVTCFLGWFHPCLQLIRVIF